MKRRKNVIYIIKKKKKKKLGLVSTYSVKLWQVLDIIISIICRKFTIT